MRASEVKKLLKVSPVTLCKYVKNGTLQVTKLGNGRYEYEDASVYKFLGLKEKKIEKYNCIYCRCSNPPKKYLDSQEERLLNFCTSKGIEISKSFRDIKSGMNFDRKDFNEMLSEIISGKIDTLVVENKDRLCRFGFELLEKLCSFYGTKILVANNLTEKNFEEELTEDLLAIIHYFSMKSYSHRRKLNRLKQELENDNSED